MLSMVLAQKERLVHELLQGEFSLCVLCGQPCLLLETTYWPSFVRES